MEKKNKNDLPKQEIAAIKGAVKQAAIMKQILKKVKNLNMIVQKLRVDKKTKIRTLHLKEEIEHKFLKPVQLLNMISRNNKKLPPKIRAKIIKYLK